MSEIDGDLFSPDTNFASLAADGDVPAMGRIDPTKGPVTIFAPARSRSPGSFASVDP